MRLDELVKAQGNSIRKIAGNYGVKAVRFFGKIEWDSDKPEGSVFVLAELAPQSTLFDHAHLSLDLKTVFGADVEVFSHAALQEDVLGQLIKGGVPLTHDDEYNLGCIQTAIEKMERYKKLGREMFEQNELVQTFVVHQLQIIHVLSNRISDQMKEEADEVDWNALVPLAEIPLYKGRRLIDEMPDGHDKDLVALSTMAYALDLVQTHAKRTLEEFLHDDLLKAWAAHHLTVAGDAARSLSQDVVKEAPEIPWFAIVEVSYILEMSANDIDWREVYNTLTRELDPIIDRLTVLKNKFEN